MRFLMPFWLRHTLGAAQTRHNHSYTVVNFCEMSMIGSAISGEVAK